MTTRTNKAMGALLCLLATMGCEAKKENTILAPPLYGTEPVEVFILNLSGSEATLQLELATGVRDLGSVPPGGADHVTLDEDDLLGGAFIRIRSDSGASAWLRVFAGSDVEVVLDEEGGISAYTIHGEMDGHPHEAEW